MDDRLNYDSIEEMYQINKKLEDGNKELQQTQNELIKKFIKIIITMENIKKEPRMIKCCFFEDDKQFIEKIKNKSWEEIIKDGK
jgi:DNA-binding MltR family transcriptional regulator